MLAVFIIVVLFAAGKLSSQIVAESGDLVSAGSETAEMAFFSGDRVNLSVTSTDDIFAAGETIMSDSVSADHLVMAGGTITVKNANIEDLVIAGGELRLASGKLNDDLLAAGGDVRIQSGFDIGGSAIVSGSDVRIEAPVRAELRAAAGKLYLNSAVGGDAKLMGDTIELGPKARISGDLQYRTDSMTISPSAVISGTQSVLPPQEHEEFERWGKGGAALAAIFSTAFIFGVALLVVVVAITLPGLMSGAARSIKEQPLRTFGIGFLLAILAPFALAMLFATVIGIPLALLIAAIYLAATPLAIAATVYFAGMQGRRMVGKKTNDQAPGIRDRLIWPLAAVVVIVLLGMLPYIGGVIWLLALILGLGAILPRGGQALARNAS
ncbi:hypothetical protein [Parasphingorhabdus marina]|nr:hypothetical protein [Parasphingorhabdus marina]